ncbi:hypothetical protein GCM10010873_16230 [Cypionkella aquatica]|uniref:Uncharacterized protein n=1 Tax=Cypionkella aquatica TaxID=1756042 RepID=A0AA37U382_9RHOB|nr:hypothetical protein [Cypionkella aquatica]GLS86649.1 hypothetical protein GCM10010873_16230 [Cypionkella aquatica]
MGEVLQLRVPAIKLGHDDVILVPRETNTEAARAVLARPSLHTENMMRAACIWLRDNSDWIDQERARHVLKMLDRQKIEDASWAREKREMYIIGLFAAICLIGIAIFDAAWGAHLAAGVAR